ncbi:MAG TPA: sn-glycerol-3-phosphate ABC transporter permease UgpA [Bdellovibrionota bacterium]|jgi:sn-glycerol 3-phosphate transport system permease protein
MIKRAHFRNPVLPYLLIFPQILVTVVFFFWPAGAALMQAFLISDAFGQKSRFVWFENFATVFSVPEYKVIFLRTLWFSLLVTLLSMGAGLLLAVLANRAFKLRKFFSTMIIWPYAVAPAIAGILWMFLFHPSYGAIGRHLHEAFDWNPTLNATHAMVLVVVASSWKQISYNFVFFLGALQSVPRSLIEAACIDGAGPARRFFVITLPLLSPTLFFLLVMNFVYAFFETFGVIHSTTEGGPGGATSTLVYKVYSDGFVGLDLGGSAAQSVVLMVITIALTFVQFRYAEKRVHYSGGR